MIGAIGALSYFLQSWSLPFAIVLLLVVNTLFKLGVIDPRNKAYGLNYSNGPERPAYNMAALQAMCTPKKMEDDKQNMVEILERWKAKQSSSKPLMVFINVSGGGLRSAVFTMHCLQELDKLTAGNLMKQTFLMTGASGGMLAATYYRELCRKSIVEPTLNRNDKKYVEAISGDLLNPVFTSLTARDILAPSQKFKAGNFFYVKDRGYAFEKKLIDNTQGLLQLPLAATATDEKKATIPLLFFNAVVKSDGRKVVMSTQPVSFMMKGAGAENLGQGPDAIDFATMFAQQQPMQMRLSTALRMNATFPYVLPNVWLPSNPVIDVMDAGLRDNYGQETTLRFLDHFKDWIKEKTGGVLVLQIRDHAIENWSEPFETNNMVDFVLTPATMLQHNWFKLQDYFQNDKYSYFTNNYDSAITRVNVIYLPQKNDKMAALNLHITSSEKKDVLLSFNNAMNNVAIKKVTEMLK